MASNAYADVESTSTPILVYAGASGSAGSPVSLVIKALAANSAAVYIGTDVSVATTTGFPLSAGEAIAVDLIGISGLYVVSAASQHVRYIVLGK